MVNKEILLHDLYILSKSFYKVIEVNLNDGTYFEVKVDDEEPHIYNNIKYWMDEFVAAGGVHRQWSYYWSGQRTYPHDLPFPVETG